MQRDSGVCEKEAGKLNYWDNITKIKNKQTEKGISEYGQPLEEYDSAGVIERLTAIEEELVDALMYLEHLKARLEKRTTYKVYTLNKKTGKVDRVIDSGLTEAEAENICESWGWNYCDENGINYWIEYAEE